MARGHDRLTGSGWNSPTRARHVPGVPRRRTTEAYVRISRRCKLRTSPCHPKRAWRTSLIGCLAARGSPDQLCRLQQVEVQGWMGGERMCKAQTPLRRSSVWHVGLCLWASDSVQLCCESNSTWELHEKITRIHRLWIDIHDSACIYRL